MPDIQTKIVRGPVRSIGRREFVALLAMSMALGALGIDLMLPAFDAMRADLGLEPGSNRIAGVITTYFLGLATGTLVYGPLADRFGRKSTLLGSYAVYALGGLASTFAPTLEVLLLTRFLWGFGAAGARVVALAVVRDAYEGDEMSRIMSLIMAIFVLVPVIAPTIGALIVAVSSWRWVFGICVLAAAGIALWTTRLPETLHEEYRLEARFGRLVHAARVVVSNRTTALYALAMTALYAVFIGYLGSTEVIFTQTFDQGRNFPYIFGALAAVFGVGMLVNVRIVRRVGTRRLTMVVLVGYLIAAALMAALALLTGGRPPLPVFLVGLAALFGSHALLIPNMNSIAMGPMAEVAGTASSIIGATQLGLGALLGSLIDGAFDGTIRPLAFGFLAYGLVAALLVFLAESSRRAERPAHRPTAVGSASG